MCQEKIKMENTNDMNHLRSNKFVKLLELPHAREWSYFVIYALGAFKGVRVYL